MTNASAKKYSPDYTQSGKTQQPEKQSEPEVIAARPALRAQTNALAIVSLVLSVVAFFGTSGLLSPVSLILALIAKSQIKQTGEDGENLANVAMIVSLLQLVLVLVMLICAGTIIGFSCCIIPFTGSSNV